MRLLSSAALKTPRLNVIYTIKYSALQNVNKDSLLNVNITNFYRKNKQQVEYTIMYAVIRRSYGLWPIQRTV